MSDGHAPTPWGYRPCDDGTIPGYALVAGDKTIATFRAEEHPLGPMDAEAVGNIKITCRAVNSYEAMSELVTFMRREHPDGSVHFDSCCTGSVCTRFCVLGRVASLTLGEKT